MIRDLIKGPFERVILTRIIGKILWTPLSVAVLAEGENNDVLVLNYREKYELPGGLVKSGEKLREAARREVMEETGFNVEIMDVLDIHEHGGITIFFHGKVVGGEGTGSWEGEPEFLEKEKVSEKAWRREHKHIEDYLFPEEFN